MLLLFAPLSSVNGGVISRGARGDEPFVEVAGGRGFVVAEGLEDCGGCLGEGVEVVG
jgi:hypothetical protein